MTASYGEAGQDVYNTYEKYIEGISPLGAAIEAIGQASGMLASISGTGIGSELHATAAKLAKAHDQLQRVTGENQAALMVAFNSIGARLDGRQYDGLSIPHAEIPNYSALSDVTPQQAAEVNQSSASDAYEQTDHGTQREAFVSLIDEELANGTPAENLPGYVDSGGFCHVFEAPGEPGILVKLPRIDLDQYPQEPGNHTTDIEYIQPLQHGQGVPGLEQMVGYTHPSEGYDGAVYVKRADGKAMIDKSNDEVNVIPDQDFDKILVTFEAMIENGLTPEMSPKNVFHGDSGFTIIDYGLAAPNAVSQRSMHNLALEFAETLLLNDWQPGQQMPQAGQRFLTIYGRSQGEQALEVLKSAMRKNLDSYSGFPAGSFVVPD